MKKDEWTLDFDDVEDLKDKVIRDGYLWDDQLDMSAHRAVAYRTLGRKLQTTEVVHHCNHVKTCNDRENLFVVSPLLHAVIHLAPWSAGVYELGYTKTNMRDHRMLCRFLDELGAPYIWLGDKKYVSSR